VSPRFLRLALGTLLASAALAPAQVGPAEGRPPIAWAELAKAPSRFHGEELRLRVQFHSLPARWLAGPTRFGPGDFACVSAWSDEQWPWIEAEFGAPLVRAFVRRGGALERTFATARAHQRFELRGIVREVWRDRAWIEIVAAEPLAEEIGEASVIHAARALALMAEESWILARSELEQALNAPLPAEARVELERLRLECEQREPGQREGPAPEPAPNAPR
jgi:hypothetical protein